MSYLLILEKLKSILPFLIKNWREVLIVVLGILVVLFYWHGRNERDRAEEAERGRDAAITISNGWQKMSTVYKNKYGDQVIKTQALEVDKVNLEVLSKSKELQWLKKFEGLKKNASNLQSASSFSTDFNLDAVPEKIKYIRVKDSLKITEFSIHDQWNNIHAMVTEIPEISISDRYYGVVYMKRPKGWFWKFQWSKWESVSEITNSNKLIRIDSVAVIVIKK